MSTSTERQLVFKSEIMCPWIFSFLKINISLHSVQLQSMTEKLYSDTGKQRERGRGNTIHKILESWLVQMLIRETKSFLVGSQRDVIVDHALEWWIDSHCIHKGCVTWFRRLLDRTVIPLTQTSYIRISLEWSGSQICSYVEYGELIFSPFNNLQHGSRLLTAVFDIDMWLETSSRF